MSNIPYAVAYYMHTGHLFQSGTAEKKQNGKNDNTVIKIQDAELHGLYFVETMLCVWQKLR